MTTQEINNLIGSQAQRAADQFHRAACQDPYTALFLYYRTAELGAFGDRPDPSWTLASGERISISSTREQNARKFAEIARRLPILPIEERSAK